MSNNCIQLLTLRWATSLNIAIAICTLHDFLSSNVRFIHTSTVTKSHSCYRKKTTRTPCLHLVNVEEMTVLTLQ